MNIFRRGIDYFLGYTLNERRFENDKRKRIHFFTPQNGIVNLTRVRQNESDFLSI